MTIALSGTLATFGNSPTFPILTAGEYTPPTESPDSERLLGPLWTCSGLTLNAPCRLYCGDRWRSAVLVATGLTDQGEGFALVRTAKGSALCTDRRNLQTIEEARLFKNHQKRWRNQRKAALRRHEEGQSYG